MTTEGYISVRKGTFSNLNNHCQHIDRIGDKMQDADGTKASSKVVLPPGNDEKAMEMIQ